MLWVLPGWGVKGGGVACGEEQERRGFLGRGSKGPGRGGGTLQDGW